jgi:hypothetical protein
MYTPTACQPLRGKAGQMGIPIFTNTTPNRIKFAGPQTTKAIKLSTFRSQGDANIRKKVEGVCQSPVTSVGAGMLHHIEVHLDSLQYQHISQNVMLPSVRMLYPDGIIHIQQDHCSIHDSRVVKE